MPGKRKFDEQIGALDALRQLADEDKLEPLRKALGNRNNFLVAKAADLAREFRLPQLTPDILSAFDRFFENPEKTDPQCWAKNALSRALAAFEHQDPEVFLRGMRHIQLEPVWGGRSDTAGTLRSNLRAGARAMPSPARDRSSLASYRSIRGSGKNGPRGSASRCRAGRLTISRFDSSYQGNAGEGRTGSPRSLLQRYSRDRRSRRNSLRRSIPSFRRRNCC